jgi:hypothetical protein
MVTRFSVALAWACAALVAACGGGGSGGGNDARFSFTLEGPALAAEVIEGRFPEEVNFTAIVRTGTDELVHLFLVEDQGIVIGGSLLVEEERVSVNLRLAPDLPEGVHTANLQFHACFDEQCSRPLPGSPVNVPLRFEVLPQIKIQAPVAMQRSGREPAPEQSLHVRIPSPAGNLILVVQGDANAFDIQLQGDQLHVQTRQLRAGNYASTVILRGETDAAYQATVDLSYVVHAPAGGELPLQLTPAAFQLYLVQGTITKYRFKVDRPTWTDALDPPVLSASPIVKDLRDLGNDEFEFTVDTTLLAPSPTGDSEQTSHYAFVSVRAGDYGESRSLDISAIVNPGVVLGNDLLTVEINATTQSTELRKTTSVTVPDGAAVRWQASSDQAWLRLVRASGITGVDGLQYEIDPLVLARPGITHVARLSIAVERPGTLPLVRTLGVRNLLPRFDMASPGSLTSSQAKVHIHGRVLRETGLLQPGVLQVDGATLRAATIEIDPRFIGEYGQLVLDLDNIVAGQDVIVRTTAPLGATQVTLRSLQALAGPAGYASLPLARRRPPSFGPRGGALLFAEADRIWRWPLAGGVWQAPHAAATAGARDLALAPDEAEAYVLTANAVMALDPQTLALRRQGALGFADAGSFDPAVPEQLRSLAYAADGRAFASLALRTDLVDGRGVGWLSGSDPIEGLITDLAANPAFRDPGSELRDTSGSARGAGIARSAGGGRLALTYPAGRVRLYLGTARQHVEAVPVPAGRLVVGIDDAGNWTVRDDGVLQRTDAPASVDLSAALGSGWLAGGYALTGSGSFALAYVYRVVPEGGLVRARDARLLMFDLRGGIAALGSNPVPVATVALPDAVGCTTALAVGEACEHQAHVLTAPGDNSAFVLGPRGVAVVPLPTVAPLAGRERPSLRVSHPLIRAQIRPATRVGEAAD